MCGEGAVGGPVDRDPNAVSATSFVISTATVTTHIANIPHKLFRSGTALKLSSSPTKRPANPGSALGRLLRREWSHEAERNMPFFGRAAPFGPLAVYFEATGEVEGKPFPVFRLDADPLLARALRPLLLRDRLEDERADPLASARRVEVKHEDSPTAGWVLPPPPAPITDSSSTATIQPSQPSGAAISRLIRAWYSATTASIRSGSLTPR
jgi:hypothetical protein